MTRRLLVTGRDGFVGRTLERMAAAGAWPDWSLCALPAGFDLLDGAAVHDLVGASAPDAVLHLAAQSSVAASWRDPALTFRVNVLGTLHLLQALQAAGFRGRIVYVGTGDVYGLVPEDRLPVGEDLLPVPRNPYAVSKLAAEALCRQWAITEDMAVLLARPFNHIGPGQSDEFAVASFARQLARVRLGLQAPTLLTGDLDVSRDFTDVRDVVRAYFALLERGTPGRPYNVCSGRETRLRDLLEGLIARAGVDVEVMTDPARLRRAEQRRMRGSAAQLQRDTGWTPAMPLDETLDAVFDAALEREGERT